ncbi:unnamed protein product [Mytilus coruscus]|uniref:Uncharacterized protein n=1 Tax=Mytilus coruscus TaxID=42192 RepID=A0A6J8DE04_MYTCO|nr:unnamed protein product [Mytilus coruscus]
MGRTRETRNRSLSPAPSVSVVRTPISSKPHERRDLPEVKSQVTPSKFFGKVWEDFESWIKIFDRISRANRWSDGRKGKMLPVYLRGIAADYFEDLDIEIQNDFGTAVQKLKQILSDIEILNIKPNYKHIVSATGQPLDITGIIECEISVNSEVSVHNMYVVEDFLYDAIIGIDIMKRIGIVIDMKDEAAYWNDMYVKFVESDDQNSIKSSALLMMNLI